MEENTSVKDKIQKRSNTPKDNLISLISMIIMGFIFYKGYKLTQENISVGYLYQFVSVVVFGYKLYDFTRN